MAPVGLADIAEQVLREAGGGPLHYREITERATSAGLVTPTGETPWASINAAMGVDNRRREARGELPRFVGAGSGYYRLRTAATEVEQAIERWSRSSGAFLRAFNIEMFTVQARAPEANVAGVPASSVSSCPAQPVPRSLPVSSFSIRRDIRSYHSANCATLRDTHRGRRRARAFNRGGRPSVGRLEEDAGASDLAEEVSDELAAGGPGRPARRGKHPTPRRCRPGTRAGTRCRLRWTRHGRSSSREALSGARRQARP
jgi:hypothetical protein